MLAYVFWHRRRPEVSRSNYEESLVEFHKSLKEALVKGYIGSAVGKIETSAPWMGSGTDAYADWYLISNSEVLDRLNDAAVSGGRKDPHDKAAHAAMDIHGGLYKLKTEALETPTLNTEFAQWFSKPAGWNYERFYGEISQFVTRPNRTSLWRRHLVLGPTPEFCILSDTIISLPEESKPIFLLRRSKIFSNL